MVNFEFRPFFRSKEERTEKRREQVRRAQKTFRERRDQYLRLLERQLSRFQAENARLISEAEQLRSESSALQRRLNHCEDALRKYRLITPEYDWPDGDHHSADTFMSQTGPFPDVRSESVTAIRLNYQDGKPHRLVITPSSSGSPQETFTNFSTPNLRRRGTTKQKQQDESPPTHSPSRYLYKAQFVAHLDTVVVAMEFVLKLESPCLPHIHDPALDGTDGDTPQGHMHTVSATLLSCISSNSRCKSSKSLTALPSPRNTNAEPDPQVATQSFNATRSILASLLQKSEELPKESQEVTPVQAWHQIEQHSCFGQLNVAELENLTDKLLEHIRCYGFGGVIKRDFLLQQLQQL